MLDIRIVWLLLLQVLFAAAASVLDCPPKKAEDEKPVRSCNYFCGKNEKDEWKMGYYINKTACEYGYGGKGICVQLPGSPGCHSPEDDEVKEFLKSTSSDSKKEPKKKVPKKKKSKKSTKKPKSKKKKNSKSTSKQPKN
uniref:Putative basic tail protein n=1 Tax=Rhipicephalus pulchellus TaxID=72859 RepID=L7LQQ4_RHIPC